MMISSFLKTESSLPLKLPDPRRFGECDVLHRPGFVMLSLEVRTEPALAGTCWILVMGLHIRIGLFSGAISGPLRRTHIDTESLRNPFLVSRSTESQLAERRREGFWALECVMCACKDSVLVADPWVRPRQIP
jgi:hypothetical protein